MLTRYTSNDAKIILRDAGIVLEYAAIAFIVPIGVSAALGEFQSVALEFILPGLVAFLLGASLKNYFYTQREAELKHAFVVAALVWLIFPVLAAIPFLLIMENMSMVDAVFESMSSVTTTGLTVMGKSLDSAPLTLIFWRSFLSWVGGVGIVLLAFVNVFPSYTRASKLVIAEGRQEKLAPKLKSSIKNIWAIYVGLTFLGASMLYLSGMTPFQAINYSMSAISTGGMSTTYEGLNAPNNYWIAEGVRNYWVDFWLIVLMVLGATSFSLLYLIMKKHNLKAFINDSEARTLLILGLLVAVISFPKLGLESALFHAFSAVTAGGFQLVSSITASGWEDIVKFLLIMLMLIGGSTNSTAGGIKIARFVIFVKSMFWKIKESMMPKGTVFSRKFEGKELRAEHLAEIYFFILAYLFFIGLGTIVVLLDGAELSDAMFEVVSAQSNAGISAGISKPGMPLATEIMLIFNMWIGRLEIIPLFALLALFKRGH